MPIKSPFPNDKYDLYFILVDDLLFTKIFTGDNGIGMRIEERDSGKSVKYIDTDEVIYDIQFLK